MDLLSTFVWKLKIHLLHTFWLEFFFVQLEMDKNNCWQQWGTVVLALRGVSWFWLFIVTRENFVLVYVFDKSRSITSFSSFSTYKISINILITFFFADRQTGVLSSIPPKIRFVLQLQIYGFHFNQHKLSPRFSFHRPYFFKKYCGSFRSASRHQHTYI